MSRAICQLHRAVVILLLVTICGAAGGTAGVLFYSRAMSGLYGGAGSWTSALLQQWSGYSNRYVALHAGMILTAAIGVTVLALLFLWLELRKLAQHTPRLVLSRGGLGEVAINLDQIGMLAQREAEHISGVREVETSAQSRKGGIDVKQTIAVEPEIALTPLAEQVQQRVKKSLEYHLGFPVSSVQVLLQQASLRKNVI